MILFSLLTEILLNDYKNSPLAQLLSVLKSAKNSIKICVYSLSFEPIIDLLIDLCLNNDVMIRIITNGENNSKNNSKNFSKVKRMQDLLQFGIESKIINLKEGFMHNKFAIIDDLILINGSLNWTQNAIFNNYEDVLITSNSKLVFTYLLKFNSLWSHSSH